MKCLQRFMILMALCVLLTSCGEKKDIPSTEVAIPSDSLISTEKMVQILADVQVVEAALALDRKKNSQSKEDPDRLYQGIFRKYHISRRRYDENLKFYSQNPEMLTKIYDKVIVNLENRQKNLGPRK